MGCIDGCILATQRWDVHCETDGTVLLAVCFKSTRDEAPGASWEKWTALIYSGYAALNMHILKQTARRCVPCVSKLFVTKLPSLRGTCTFWNRRRCAVCRVFQKSSWRSSRRFVEKWVVWMYIKDAALKRHNLKQTARRCVPCVSKVFVTKLPSLRGEMGCMDVY